MGMPDYILRRNKQNKS